MNEMNSSTIPKISKKKFENVLDNPGSANFLQDIGKAAPFGSSKDSIANDPRSYGNLTEELEPDEDPFEDIKAEAAAANKIPEVVDVNDRKGKGKAKQQVEFKVVDDNSESTFVPEGKKSKNRETLVAVSKPKSFKAVLDNVGSHFMYKTHDTRCVLVITPNDNLKEGDKGYIGGKHLGQMSDLDKGYFLEVTYRVEHREGEVPQQDHTNESKDPKRQSPEGVLPIWFTYLLFKITLKYSYERLSETHVDTDPIQDEWISIPAANLNQSHAWTNGEEDLEDKAVNTQDEGNIDETDDMKEDDASDWSAEDSIHDAGDWSAEDSIHDADDPWAEDVPLCQTVFNFSEGDTPYLVVKGLDGPVPIIKNNQGVPEGAVADIIKKCSNITEVKYLKDQ